jgi:hypothetical protein
MAFRWASSSDALIDKRLAFNWDAFIISLFREHRRVMGDELPHAG